MATNFANGAKSNFVEIISQNNIGSTLYNTRELAWDGVFGESNFVEVPNLQNLRNLRPSKKSALWYAYGTKYTYGTERTV